MERLRFDFIATECQGWPKIRICIDGDVLLDHDFSEPLESVEIEYDVIDGKHTIEIERWGKQHFNVVCHENQILQDQTVTLDNIWIDDVCLPDWVKTSGTFTWEQGSIPNGLTWGPNGVFSIPIVTPLLSWVIKQNIEKNGDIIGVYVPTQRNLQQLHERLEEFQKDLDRVNV